MLLHAFPTVHPNPLLLGLLPPLECLGWLLYQCWAPAHLSKDIYLNEAFSQHLHSCLGLPNRSFLTVTPHTLL